MGMDTRNSYLQQQIEEELSSAIGDSTTTSPDALPTVEELFLAVTAVNQKVANIQGRMRILEAAFNILFQKTTEISEELRLTREELAVKNQVLVLLQSSRIDYTAVLQEAERLRMENASNMGER